MNPDRIGRIGGYPFGHLPEKTPSQPQVEKSPRFLIDHASQSRSPPHSKSRIQFGLPDRTPLVGTPDIEPEPPSGIGYMSCGLSL